MAEILDVTEATFDEQVLRSETPVLVDFWAEWCAPCKQLAPTIKELAQEYDGQLRVAKVDADASPGLAAKYSVRALPTVLLLKDGQVTGSHVGVGGQVKATLKKQIEATLGG